MEEHWAGRLALKWLKTMPAKVKRRSRSVGAYASMTLKAARLQLLLIDDVFL